MPIQNSQTEHRLRKLVRQQGYALKKSRSRNPHDPSFGGYMIVEPFHNTAEAGGYPNAFSLSREDVAAWLNG